MFAAIEAHFNFLNTCFGYQRFGWKMVFNYLPYHQPTNPVLSVRGAATATTCHPGTRATSPTFGDRTQSGNVTKNNFHVNVTCMTRLIIIIYFSCINISLKQQEIIIRARIPQILILYTLPPKCCIGNNCYQLCAV